MVEVETKAYCNADEMETRLTDAGAEFIERRLQQDSYYSPDSFRKLAFRVRRTGTQSFFTIKGKSVHPEGGAWPEWEQELMDPDELEALLASGLTHVITLEKDRSLFTLGDFSIYVDRIELLGEFIEVELISDEVQEAKDRIKALMTVTLGISEDDFVFKGYLSLLEDKGLLKSP